MLWEKESELSMVRDTRDTNTVEVSVMRTLS